MTTVAPAKVRLPLLAIVVAAVALIAARMVWPGLNFDTTSLILFGIAAIAWALAFLPLTRLKFGEFEADLAPMVAAFEQKVIASEAAQAAAPRQTRPGVVMRGGPSPEGPAIDPAVSAAFEEYRAIVESLASDREKIVRVAVVVERLARDGRVDPAARDAVDVLLRLRDQVVEGRAEPTPQLTSTILDFAGRLMKTIAG
jgi:hypothetical protein